MGFLCIGASSSSLLCGEDKDSLLGCDNDEGEVLELGRNLDFLGTVGFLLESDELIGSLMEKEREQLVGFAMGDYLERLNNEGLEFSWRIDAIDWICKVQAHYNFRPLCVYLAVNYLDRFLSSKQLPHDKPWMQQLLTVACLSIAAKMEETVVPQSLDLQVCDAKYVFEAKTIKRMEILVLSTLKWRMQAVTPFSFIDCFLDKFNEGKPLTYELVSRCTELILATLKATKFLQFRPSEISVAAALSASAEAQVLDFGSALLASKIPVDKESVGRCHEAMQEMALLKKRVHNSASPSVSKSPSGVLDASCFSFRSDDNKTPGSSHSNNSSSINNQACTPASKRTRLDAAAM